MQLGQKCFGSHAGPKEMFYRCWWMNAYLHEDVDLYPGAVRDPVLIPVVIVINHTSNDNDNNATNRDTLSNRSGAAQPFSRAEGRQRRPSES